MKLKKGTALLLALFVLMANTGFALNLHFCGGKIARVSYGFAALPVVKDEVATPKSCCAAKAEKNESCCKDKSIKASEKSDVVVKTFAFQADVAVLQTFATTLVPSVKSPSLKTRAACYNCEAHGPPLYELYSRLIFYA